MSWIRSAVFRLRGLLTRQNVDQDLDDELAFHVEMETRERMRQGLSAEEAHRRALLDLGGIERWKGAARDERSVPWLDELARDLRHAARGLLASPGFTLVSVATLALGIGANTAIFSVVDGVLLRPLPTARADRIVVVWETDRHSGTVHEPASVPDYLDSLRRSRTLSDLAAVEGSEANLSGEAGGGANPQRVNVLAATPGYLAILGVRPLLGRGLVPDDGRPGGPGVVLLDERCWRSRFQADPGVVGRTLDLDGRPWTVVGVLPAAAGFGVGQILGRADYARSFGENDRRGVDLWVPLRPDPERLPRTTHPILLVGRLAPGASVAAAQEELAAIAADLENRYPENNGRGIHVEPLREVVLGPVRTPLLVLLGAVAVVLLIAGVNVANLLLARGTRRTQEVALRTALGASRVRLGRQFLAESALLNAVSAAAGVAVGFAALRLLLALAPPGLPRLDAVGLDLRVLGVTLAVALVVTLVFGMVPLLQARAAGPQAAFRSRAGRGGAGDRHHRSRDALVVVEVALAALLAVGATLLLRSFWQLHQVDPGFRTRGVLSAEVQLPESRYPRDYSVWPRWSAQHRFVEKVLDELETAPQVEAAALSGAHPLAAGFTNSWAVVGRKAESRTWPEISMRLVTPDYFTTLGVPLVAGRALGPGDDVDGPRVALVNRTTAERYFPGGSPVGHEIILWGLRWRIVGVVGDVHFAGLDTAAPPAAYVPLAQAPSNALSLVVRTSGDPRSLVPLVRAAVRAADRELAVFEVEPLAETVSGSLAERRFVLSLLAAFAGLALLLAVIGVHGVLSYRVARRGPEVGIRMALGARRGEVMAMIVRQGVGLTAIGLALGLAAAAGCSRLLAGLLYATTPDDPLTFAAVAAGVLAAATAASLLPSRRAATADPAEALRAE